MNGKNIQPIQIWQNGTFVTANFFALQLIFDNLFNTAKFYYVLYNKSGTPAIYTQVTDGNSNISGTQYIAWGQSQDVNEEAYTIVAQNLNISII